MESLNENQRKYIIIVFVLSVIILLIVAIVLGGTEDPAISYLLSLIAANSIVKEVKDMK